MVDIDLIQGNPYRVWYPVNLLEKSSTEKESNQHSTGGLNTKPWWKMSKVETSLIFSRAHNVLSQASLLSSFRALKKYLLTAPNTSISAWY